MGYATGTRAAFSEDQLTSSAARKNFSEVRVAIQDIMSQIFLGDYACIVVKQEKKE